MVTITDVARAAGVSRSTVSRVLNEQPGVSPETRARVLEAIAALHYQPHFAARALKRQQAENIGIIVPNSFREPTGREPRGYYNTEIVRGAFNFCTEQHYAVTLLNDEGTFAFYASLFRRRQFDGIVLINVDMDLQLLEELKSTEFPFVVVGNIPDPHVSSVDVDNYGSSQRVVRYLHRLGHRLIAIINGPPERLASRDRRAGFRTMMRQLGLPLIDEFDQEGDFSVDSGYQAMRRLLRLSHPPTAVYAINDRMAIGALQAAHELGLDVPADVSIVGFDDIPVAAYLTPPLTTVRQPLYELGQTAAKMLFDIINGVIKAPTRGVLPATLVERQSVASPRAFSHKAPYSGMASSEHISDAVESR